jgi:hypothetical protein
MSEERKKKTFEAQTQSIYRNKRHLSVSCCRPVPSPSFSAPDYLLLPHSSQPNSHPAILPRRGTRSKIPPTQVPAQLSNLSERLGRYLRSCSYPSNPRLSRVPTFPKDQLCSVRGLSRIANRPPLCLSKKDQELGAPKLLCLVANGFWTLERLRDGLR